MPRPSVPALHIVLLGRDGQAAARLAGLGHRVTELENAADGRALWQGSAEDLPDLVFAPVGDPDLGDLLALNRRRADRAARVPRREGVEP